MDQLFIDLVEQMQYIWTMDLVEQMQYIWTSYL